MVRGAAPGCRLVVWGGRGRVGLPDLMRARGLDPIAALRYGSPLSDSTLKEAMVPDRSEPRGARGLVMWLLGLALCLPLPGRAGEAQVLEAIEAMRSDLDQLRQEVRDLRRSVDALSARPPGKGGGQVAFDLPLEEDDPAQGSPEAGVVLMEFFDFECPFCRRFHARTYPRLKRDYIDTGKLRFVVRDYPLGGHAQAHGAALAANCAARQDAYWPMFEQLLANGKGLGEPLYGRLAHALALDPEAFDACRADPALAEEVDGDVRVAKGIGINGTPTFLIGRREGDSLRVVRRIGGAQPYAAFAAAIDAVLAQGQARVSRRLP
jgi:protein-disulfide isomerase